MSCFDPYVLLNLPLEQATFCFPALYDSFSLRGWLANSPKIEARDEYIDFLDHFRNAHSNMQNSLGVFTDMVRFLIAMPELRMREHLNHIFRLSCPVELSLFDSRFTRASSSQIPRGPDYGDPRSRLFDVIMPSQSYLTNVPNAISICTSDASLGKYRDLESKFSCGNVAGDPWSHVDSFGKASFQKVLTSVYRTLDTREIRYVHSNKVAFALSVVPEVEKSAGGYTPGPSKL